MVHAGWKVCYQFDARRNVDSFSSSQEELENRMIHFSDQA